MCYSTSFGGVDTRMCELVRGSSNCAVYLLHSCSYKLRLSWATSVNLAKCKTSHSTYPEMQSVCESRLVQHDHAAVQSHRSEASDGTEPGQMPRMHSLTDGITTASSKSLGSQVAPVKQSSSRRRSLESRRGSLDRRGSRYSTQYFAVVTHAMRR